MDKFQIKPQVLAILHCLLFQGIMQQFTSMEKWDKKRRKSRVGKWGGKKRNRTGKIRLNRGWGWASLVAQMIKNLPAMQETQVWSLGREDLLEKGMATHSSILAGEFPLTDKPGGLQSMSSQRSDEISTQNACWGLPSWLPLRRRVAFEFSTAKADRET